MHRSIDLQSSSRRVQQMMAWNPNNWWNNINTTIVCPPAPQQLPPSPFSSSLPLITSWNQEHPHQSWSQLLMSGLVSEEDKGRSIMWQQQQEVESKKWEEEQQISMLITPPNHHQPPNVKQESSVVINSNYVLYGATELQTGVKSSMLNFSNNTRQPPPSNPSSQCNIVAGAFKKARIQPSTTQPTFKVRKEKLGERVTALHQLVSPFGKTDTASVLLEAIGYISFLHGQIKALSLPYMGTGSGNIRHQQYVQGEKNCIFPEDPGQDCEEEKKELRSRGLCLVPVSSCILQVGKDNNIGADYWGLHNMMSSQSATKYT